MRAQTKYNHQTLFFEDHLEPARIRDLEAVVEASGRLQQLDECRTAHPRIAQAAIFGEARPFNCAVIVPRPGIPQDVIEAALDTANRTLPDYARVRAWIAATEPITPGNGMSTPNGRLRRSAILVRYAAQIDALYQP